MPEGAEAGAVAAYSNVVARVPANNPTGTKLGAASRATDPNLSPGVICGADQFTDDDATILAGRRSESGSHFSQWL